MKTFWITSTICLLAAGCMQYGSKFNARTPEQTQETKRLQQLRPLPKKAELAKTAVEFETVPSTNTLDPMWLKPPTEPFRLGPGDKLEIELLSDPAGTRTLTSVGPDGKIYFYLLPGLDVWGLTLAETKSLLELELKKYIRDKAYVGVTLRTVESKRVWLLGRLQAPGVYPMPTPMTLLEALSLAGGTVNFTQTTDISQLATSEELADLKHSFIVRDGKMLPVDFYKLLKEGDLSQNIYLEPDDLIYLPPQTGRQVYVMGAVVSPRTVPYHEGMTLVETIQSASGMFRDSYATHVAIVRGSLTEPKVAVVDYKSILHGNATDVLLEPRDIVYVPLSPYRILRRYTDLIMATFVSSVAINEGSRAVLKNAPAPTGILIPFGSKISISGGPSAVGGP